MVCVPYLEWLLLQTCALPRLVVAVSEHGRVEEVQGVQLVPARSLADGSSRQGRQKYIRMHSAGR